MIQSEKLLGTKTYTLTVTTDPSSATCTLTYDGISYSTKSAKVKAGTVISYSIYHSTYGTTTGSITMDSNKTLTCTGTYSTSTSYSDSYYSRPNLSSNGSLGGSSFAVDCSSYNKNRSTYNAWAAFDGDTTTNTKMWSPSSATGALSTAPYLIIYFPNPTKIKTCSVMNRLLADDCQPVSYYMYSSSSNSSYSLITSGTNSNQTAGATWSFNVNNTTSTSSSYYKKYYKLEFGTDWKYKSNTVKGIIEVTFSAYTLTSTPSYNYYWNTTIS